MRILVVEDDHHQAYWIGTSLLEGLPGAQIRRISTELGFRSRLADIADDPPDVIIMDIMLRWTDPSPDLQEPPADVRKDGFYAAGLRCERLLAENERTSGIPVIFYTVLEESDVHQKQPTLRENVHYLPKESDPKPLIDKVREVTSSNRGSVS
jgi:CheY-like chemotaxis protein